MVVKKMKEKCKDAARKRREKERAEFLELSKLLPLPASTTSQLDKASIIRLTSSYLRMRSAFPEGLGNSWGDNAGRHNQSQPQQQIRELGSLLLQTLDGFVVALHSDGKIMYISETASVHLGLPQNDLTGSSVFEYVEPSDRPDVSETLAITENDRLQLEAHKDQDSCELARSFCMRMKCILPKRNAGLVTGGYKAIHCNGYLKVRRKLQVERADTLDQWESYALVAVGHSLLPTASTEVKLASSTFMFRANLDFKLFYMENPMLQLLGFEQAEMIGHSVYQFLHPNDCPALEKSHRSLLDKGQAVTRYHRLIKKNGGSIWVQSYATLVSNPRNLPKPYHIVSICFVLANNQFDQSCILYQKSKRLESSDKADQADQLAQINPQLRKGQLKTGGELVLKRSARVKEPNKRLRKMRPQIQQQMMEVQASTHYDNQICKPIAIQEQYQCPCSLQAPNQATDSSLGSIGSIRRPSDDTCSVVSSVTGSLNLSSSSSSSSCSSSCSSRSSAGRLMCGVGCGGYNATLGGDTSYDNPSAAFSQLEHTNELTKTVSLIDNRYVTGQIDTCSQRPPDQMVSVEIVGCWESQMMTGGESQVIIECGLQQYTNDGLQNWSSLSQQQQAECSSNLGFIDQHQCYYQVDHPASFNADSMEAQCRTYESPVTFYPPYQVQQQHQPPPPPPVSYTSPCHGLKSGQVLL